MKKSMTMTLKDYEEMISQFLDSAIANAIGKTNIDEKDKEAFNIEDFSFSYSEERGHVNASSYIKSEDGRTFILSFSNHPSICNEDDDTEKDFNRSGITSPSLKGLYDQYDRKFEEDDDDDDEEDD